MSLVNLIFPKKCLECRKEGKYICDDCLKKVATQGWRGKIFSVFRYEGVVKKAIIALKYKYATEIAGELADLCARKLKAIYPVSSYYCLVPIPLHWYRQNFRGFNQAEEIGKLIAEKMDWKFIPDLLIRRKPTVPQVQLKGLARRRNLQGVFAVNPHYVPSTLNSVLIFDDVLTTGSTLKEAVKVLRLAGIKNIRGLTIAR